MAEETENKLKGRTKKKVAIWRIYLLIGFVALVVFASMGYIFYLGNHITAVNTPLKDAVMKIKIEATTAHLWFEEIISGDSSLSIDDVLEHINQADWYAKAMLEGGQNDEGKYVPLKTPDMRQEITEVRRKLTEFREITLQRWQTSSTSGIGTEIDQKYDEVFNDLVQQADLVETGLQQIITHEFKNFQIVQMVLIAVCLAVTVVIGIKFSRFLKNQIRHELELQAANLQLDAGNQQLMASEQQLRAANQQLTASEQQLKAANQQLTASEQQLKAANQQLIASEQVARILAKFPSENPNPVLRISIDNVVLYSNQAGNIILDAWGCEENRCLCLPDRENKLMKKALSSGKAVAFDFDHCGRTFSITLVPVPESEYFNMYALDVTARKQAEDQVRQERDKAQKYLDVAEVMLIVIDAEQKVRLINQKGCKILGYDEKDIIDNNWFDNFLPKRMKKEVKAAFEKLKAGEIEPVEYFENPVLTKDGDERIIAWHNTVLRNEQGCIVGALSSGEDITERKKAEETLQLERDNFINILDSMVDGVYIVDQNHDIQYVNPVLKKDFGPYENRKCYEYFHDRDKICPWCKQKDVFAGKTVRWEWDSSKNHRTYELIDTPLRNPDGSISKLEIFHDITERKKAEEKLLDHQRKLKSLASQLSRTEEHERHRLATLLHDQIGQSLVFSKLKLDSLRESISSGESADALGEVCDCLGGVIRDTRTLTFELSSPILYELGFETAVSEWLDEQIREKHGIQTEFRDDGQPKPLDNDIRAILFRNVRELLINIVKHAKARMVKVSVSKVDEQICVIIEDDGVGFEPAKIGSNIGFGIFSIRERLEQLDGHLEIESEPGHGSRFTMTAPLKVEKSTEGAEV